MKMTGLAFIVIVSILGMWWCRREQECRRRNGQLTAQKESVRIALSRALPRGSTLDQVNAFYSKISVEPFTLGSERNGTIYTSGCGPFRCGSDAALIGITVKLDSNERVESTNVMAMYTDCL